MNTKNHLIFPTLVSQAQYDVSENEKDIWFDLFLKYSNDEGCSQDYLGFENIQNDPLFENLFMQKLKDSIDEYFKCLSLNTTTLDIFLTKCFFNVTDQSVIDVHDHSENHLSFTYYPHIQKGKDRDLMFFNDVHRNEPYLDFFGNYVKDWNDINSNVVFFPISEGSLFVFPAKLKHCIEGRSNDTNGPIGKSFMDKDSLKQSRFCVAGDMIYTKKENAYVYKRALTNPKKWRSLCA